MAAPCFQMMLCVLPLLARGTAALAVTDGFAAALEADDACRTTDDGKGGQGGECALELAQLRASRLHGPAGRWRHRETSLDARAPLAHHRRSARADEPGDLAVSDRELEDQAAEALTAAGRAEDGAGRAAEEAAEAADDEAASRRAEQRAEEKLRTARRSAHVARRKREEASDAEDQLAAEANESRAEAARANATVIERRDHPEIELGKQADRDMAAARAAERRAEKSAARAVEAQADAEEEFVNATRRIQEVQADAEEEKANATRRIEEAEAEQNFADQEAAWGDAVDQVAQDSVEGQYEAEQAAAEKAEEAVAVTTTSLAPVISIGGNPIPTAPPNPAVSVSGGVAGGPATPEPIISDGGTVARGVSPSAPAQDAQPPQARVGHHHGCYMLTRKQCCTYFDGRENEWHGYACIPSQNSTAFLSGNVCEPTLYADQHPAHRGTCPDDPPSAPLPEGVIDGNSATTTSEPAISDNVAVAGSPSPPAPAAEPQPQNQTPRIAVSGGCYTLEQNECCDFFDGRNNEWSGQNCVPSRPSSKFLSGNVCEPSTYADEHPQQRGACHDDGSLSIPAQNVTSPSAPAPADDATPNQSSQQQHTRVGHHHGCYTLTRNQCCNFFDGRPNEWHGYLCIPSQNGSKFLSGNLCEPSSYADEHPEHRGMCPDDKAKTLPERQEAAAADDTYEDEEARDAGITIDGTVPAELAPPSTPSPLSADMGDSAPMAEVHEEEEGALVPQPSPVTLARLDGQRHTATELCTTERSLNFAAALVSHSNLGGAGPDAGDETLVFQDIAFARGAAVDLVVSTTSPYEPNDALKNGIRGGFGTINLRVNSAVDLLFRFVDRAGDAVEMDSFLFSVFDIDQGMSHTSRETVTLSGVSSFEVADETELTIETLADDSFSFTSSLRGGKVDNPISPMSLSKTQKERSVAATFPRVSEFTVSFSDVRFAQEQGRNFLFAGGSSMSCRREHGCAEFQCPSGYHLRTMAEFLVCEGRRCEEADRDTCCYAEPVDLAIGLL